ncbi:MAG: hypothetical protein R3Y54_07035 [Eubacteriales bacterium]
MLVKLIKYDLKMFFQTCGLLYLIGTILAIGNGILVLSYNPLNLFINMGGSTMLANNSGEMERVFVDSMFTMGMLAIAAILPVAVILIISRFYKGVFGREGYLTNTLPVTHHEIVLSKLGAAVISALVTLVVYLLQMLLFMSIATKMEVYSTLSNTWEFMVLYLNLIPTVTWISIFVLVILSLINNLLIVYLAIAIGHIFRHYILMSVVVYYGIKYLVLQPLTILIVSPFNFLWLPSDNSSMEMVEIVNTIVFTSQVSSVVLSVLCYFITIWIMKKKLNLV